MQKLIAAYLAEPTHANARKLKNYSTKHPMAVCTLTQLELGLLRFATEQLAEGR